MRTKWRLLFATTVMWGALAGIGSAQWLAHPTPGVPRTPDGQPDMSAPAPRAADGRPDLSGMYGWETRANCGARCNDTQISREFINIAVNLNPTGRPPAAEGMALLATRGHNHLE